MRRCDDGESFIAKKSLTVELAQLGGSGKGGLGRRPGCELEKAPHMKAQTCLCLHAHVISFRSHALFCAIKFSASLQFFSVIWRYAVSSSSSDKKLHFTVDKFPLLLRELFLCATIERRNLRGGEKKSFSSLFLDLIAFRLNI